MPLHVLINVYLESGRWGNLVVNVNEYTNEQINRYPTYDILVYMCYNNRCRERVTKKILSSYFLDGSQTHVSLISGNKHSSRWVVHIKSERRIRIVTCDMLKTTTLCYFKTELTVYRLSFVSPLTVVVVVVFLPLPLLLFRFLFLF